MEQFDKLKLQSWESADDVFNAVEPIINAFIFAQGYQDEKITALQEENERLKTRIEQLTDCLHKVDEERISYRTALEKAVMVLQNANHIDMTNGIVAYGIDEGQSKGDHIVKEIISEFQALSRGEGSRG